ncbi:50S ribosomal protein L10 [Coprobacillus sp. CAG:826]|nr:50S ribosomal protein L10 [Coprobacillus sp. CAG:826]
MNQDVLKGKQEIVSEVTNKLQKSGSLTVIEYHGLTVAEITDLRRKLRAESAEMTVYKNSLVHRAIKDMGLEMEFFGPNAFIFSEDVVAGPKIIAKAAKKNEHLIIKGGIVDGKVLTADEMKVIATLPGRDGLISMLLSCLQAPVRKFACAVQAIADKEN